MLYYSIIRLYLFELRCTVVLVALHIVWMARYSCDGVGDVGAAVVATVVRELR